MNNLPKQSITPVFRQTEPYPVNFISARGCELVDENGKTYLDFESGCWAAALGHTHPAIMAAMHQQMDQVMHLGTRYPNSIVDSTALDLLDISGIQDGQCLFLASGSEAVEFAVQAAKQVMSNSSLLVLEDTYLSAFGSSNQKQAGEWISLDWRACKHCHKNQPCQADCPVIASVDFNKIGAFVFESGSFSGQVEFPPVKMIQRVVSNVKSHGGFLICNEVTAGMGRTGRWFGYQHYDIQPDLLAIGKGLGNGYPVSAVVMSCNVASSLHQCDFKYAQSHQNDPLGAAVAAAVIRTLRDENILTRCQASGSFFIQALRDLQSAFPLIVDVRGRGLLIAIELVTSADAASLFNSLREQQILAGYKNNSSVIRFFPPLNVQENQIRVVLHALQASLMQLQITAKAA
jgi:acetylornithine/N-succinyldiaminopimelate aminotransferase